MKVGKERGRKGKRVLLQGEKEGCPEGREGGKGGTKGVKEECIEMEGRKG